MFANITIVKVQWYEQIIFAPTKQLW